MFTKQIARFNRGEILVSTIYNGRPAEVGAQYETGVSHPQYRGGAIIIVEEYETEQQAEQGHEGWVAAMTSDTLPPQLEDVSLLGTLIQFLAGDDMGHVYEREQ